jgi:hypothetical protein
LTLPQLFEVISLQMDLAVISLGLKKQAQLVQVHPYLNLQSIEVEITEEFKLIKFG